MVEYGWWSGEPMWSWPVTSLVVEAKCPCGEPLSVKMRDRKQWCRCAKCGAEYLVELKPTFRRLNPPSNDRS